MKTLLVILMMIPLFSWGQMSAEYLDYDIDLKLEHTQLMKKPTKTNSAHAEIHPGVAMMLGGGMFMLLGYTTPNEGEFVNGKYQQKPLYKQPAQFMAVITGGGLILTGLVITLGG